MTRIAVVLLTAVLAGCASAGPRAAPVDRAELTRQVADTERAFAKTMADRDFAAFAGFLDEETVWFGNSTTLRGKQAVLDAWKAFYEDPQAPFSWAPTTTEVLDSGTLALTSGPVYDPSGKQVAVFMSIWRQQSPGVWRIVFDRGCGYCPPKK